MLGGLAMGFLGAGLFGMLSGGGLFSGLGGLSSIIGLLLQIGLIILVVRLAMSWWRRHTPASPAYARDRSCRRRPRRPDQLPLRPRWLWAGSNQPPLEIQPADYEAFERLLGEVQAAWSNEDVAKLHTLATPEMVSYFSKDLEENKARNDVNKVTDVKLLQGDLAEAWRRRNRLRQRGDAVLAGRQDPGAHHRPSGRGSETPVEVTEVWTFARRRGAIGKLGDPADQLIATNRRGRRCGSFRGAFFLPECRFISPE